MVSPLMRAGARVAARGVTRSAAKHYTFHGRIIRRLPGSTVQKLNSRTGEWRDVSANAQLHRHIDQDWKSIPAADVQKLQEQLKVPNT